MNTGSYEYEEGLEASGKRERNVTPHGLGALMKINQSIDLLGSSPHKLGKTMDLANVKNR
jgi:hypothetical protein